MSYSPMHIFRQTHTHMHELNYWWDLCHVSMYRGEKGRTLPWWLNPLMMDWTHIFNLVFDHQILFSFMLAFWGTTGSMEELDVSRYSGSHFLYLLKSCLWNVNILSINICIFLLINGVYLFKTICWDKITSVVWSLLLVQSKKAAPVCLVILLSQTIKRNCNTFYISRSKHLAIDFMPRKLHRRGI